MIFVSACLVGVHCRYDGDANTSQNLMAFLEGKTWVPVCPEQMGGLPTPRDPVERQGDRIVTKEGLDVTEAFTRGAEEVVHLAKLLKPDLAILKAKSPSCGSNQIYDGTFNGVLIPGQGLTVQRLSQMGIPVWNEKSDTLK